jgi:hypothetical protein
MECIAGIGTQPTWGDFQSLLQLAIGLNAAFAALADFLGSSTRREKARADRLASRTSKSNLMDTQRNITMHQSFIHMSGVCKRIERNYENFLSGFVRLCCLLTLVISLFMLIYGSFSNKCTISAGLMWLSVFQIGPFVIGIAYAFILSTITYFQVTMPMNRLIRVGNL